MQRHLAAFEALDAHACTRGLALAAATAGLALPGPDAAADTHAPLAGPCIVGNLIELHGACPWSAGVPPAFFVLKVVCVESATIGRLGGRNARAPVTSLQQRGRDARLWRSSRARTACPQAR